MIVAPLVRAREQQGVSQNYQLRIGSPEYNKIRYASPAAGSHRARPMWMERMRSEITKKRNDQWKYAKDRTMIKHPAMQVFFNDICQCIALGLHYKTKTFEYTPSNGYIHVEGQYVGRYDKEEGRLKSFTLKHINSKLSRLRLKNFGIDLTKKDSKTFWKVYVSGTLLPFIKLVFLSNPNIYTIFKSVKIGEIGPGERVIIYCELIEDMVYPAERFSLDSVNDQCDAGLFFTFGHAAPNFMFDRKYSPDVNSEYQKLHFALTHLFEQKLPEATLKERISQIIKGIFANSNFALYCLNHEIGHIANELPTKDSEGMVAESGSLFYSGDAIASRHYLIPFYDFSDRRDYDKIRLLALDAANDKVYVCCMYKVLYTWNLSDFIDKDRFNTEGYKFRIDSDCEIKGLFEVYEETDNVKFGLEHPTEPAVIPLRLFAVSILSRLRAYRRTGNTRHPDFNSARQFINSLKGQTFVLSSYY